MCEVLYLRKTQSVVFYRGGYGLVGVTRHLCRCPRHEDKVIMSVKADASIKFGEFGRMMTHIIDSEF